MHVTIKTTVIDKRYMQPCVAYCIIYKQVYFILFEDIQNKDMFYNSSKTCLFKKKKKRFVVKNINKNPVQYSSLAIKIPKMVTKIIQNFIRQK